MEFLRSFSGRYCDKPPWQAYIALTLSSIENVIKLPKKSILIIRDRVSRFTENVVCVKETDGHDLKAEEEETEIENVIWDGEALLEAEIFKYDIKSARYLLFASLLYEDNRRLLSKIKTVEGFEPYDLVRVDPESVPEGYRTEDIYGFPHGHLLIK